MVDAEAELGVGVVDTERTGGGRIIGLSIRTIGNAPPRRQASRQGESCL